MRNRTIKSIKVAELDSSGNLIMLDNTELPVDNIKVKHPKRVVDNTYYKSISKVVEARVNRIKEAEEAVARLNDNRKSLERKLMPNCWDNIEKFFKLN